MNEMSFGPTRKRSGNAAKRRKLHNDPPVTTTTVSPRNSHQHPPAIITAQQLRRVVEKDENSKQCQIIYLTNDEASWIMLIEKWWPCPDEVTFNEEWELHPPERHLLKIFGRIVSEKRWSQSWGVSYAYSGSTNAGRPISPDSRVAQLLQTVNDWVQQAAAGDFGMQRPYNACLENWYEPDDTIGRHADDERDMRKGLPIFSLSWGGTRRFVLRAKANTNQKTEIFLQDGDLLVMGGTTQETHYHEIPKRRVTMDPPTSRRINWTVRAFHKKALDCNQPRPKTEAS